MPHLQHTSIRYTVLPSDPGNFAKTAHVELFELLDVFPVQGQALGAKQEGCEDDSRCWSPPKAVQPLAILAVMSSIATVFDR